MAGVVTPYTYLQRVRTITFKFTQDVLSYTLPIDLSKFPGWGSELPVRVFASTVTGPNMQNGNPCDSSMFSFTLNGMELTMTVTNYIGGPGYYTATVDLGV